MLHSNAKKGEILDVSPLKRWESDWTYDTKTLPYPPLPYPSLSHSHQSNVPILYTKSYVIWGNLPDGCAGYSGVGCFYNMWDIAI